MKFSKIMLSCLLAILVLFSCRKDQWDNRDLVKDNAETESLLDRIDADSDLSLFASYLKKTGYDKVVSSSKTFTVWAPDNKAIQALDPAYLNDTASLKLFIGNCIANQAFYSKDARDSALRIRTYSGKRVLFTGETLNGNAVGKKDITAKNGVLYTMPTAFMPQPNAFQYFSANYAAGLQYQFMKTLYDGPNVDSILKDSLIKGNLINTNLNTYTRSVNINSEDSLLTYIILTDQAYQAEEQKLQSFFIDSTVEVSDSLNQWNVIKDLTVNGVIDPAAIPPVVYSRDSVAIRLASSSIVKAVKVSNGMVYVVNHLDYDLATKIKPVVIQGERFFDRLDPEKSYTIRKRRNPANDSIFSDLFMEKQGIASYWFRYPVSLAAGTYKVYWRAVNDFQTGTFPMMLALNHHIDTTFADPKNIAYDQTLPYTTVELLNYNDVYIGDFTVPKHGLEDLFLIGNNVTSSGKNTIVCDYIKLVPVLN